MFIAHIPAGHLLTQSFLARKKDAPLSLWATGLFFSIAPDLDLLWFYLASARNVPHRHFFMHWPLFWATIAGCALTLSLVFRRSSWRGHIALGLAAVLLHLILDSITAEVYWLAPFSQASFTLIRIPAVYSWWVWNVILHWTFLLEIGMCIVAGKMFVTFRQKARAQVCPYCASLLEAISYTNTMRSALADFPCKISCTLLSRLAKKTNVASVAHNLHTVILKS